MTVNGPVRHTVRIRPGSQTDPFSGICDVCGRRAIWDKSKDMRKDGRERGWRHARHRTRKPSAPPTIPTAAPVEIAPSDNDGDLLRAILAELQALRAVWESPR